jgi:hypothetical protein
MWIAYVGRLLIEHISLKTHPPSLFHQAVMALGYGLMIMLDEKTPM